VEVTKTHRIAAAVAVFAAGLLLARAVPAHTAHHQQGAAAPAAAPAQARPVTLADTPLLDQDGRKLRLASDVAGDKLVVVSFVFTNCPDVCPMVSQTFSQVQEQLGPLMGERVRLVSLSVDPARDTPARLKEYAANYNPKPGWLWLTGEPANVTAALKGFGVHVTQADMHPNVIVVGDLRTGRWSRIYQTDSPQKIVARVKEHLAAGQHQHH
jgi:protein SCO1/2